MQSFNVNLNKTLAISFAIFCSLLENSVQYRGVVVGRENCITRQLIPEQNQELDLTFGQDSAVIIEPHSDLSNHTEDWDEDFICKITVRPTGVYHMYAVIQSMNLRINKTTGLCIDYVEFRGSSPKQIYQSLEYCGNFTADLKMDGRLNSKPGNAYSNLTRQLDVVFFISKKALMSNESTNFFIVATVHMPCEDEYYRPCFEKPGKKSGFIYKDFFNDSYVNCPYLNCLDEGGCKLPKEVIEMINKGHTWNKIRISLVVAGIAGAFLAFIMISWTLKRYKLFCYQDVYS